MWIREHGSLEAAGPYQASSSSPGLRAARWIASSVTRRVTSWRGRGSAPLARVHARVDDEAVLDQTGRRRAAHASTGRRRRRVLALARCKGSFESRFRGGSRVPSVPHSGPWSRPDDDVESGAGAPTLGSGGDSGAFVPGLSPAPIVTFPAPALRTRRADFRHRALQWDHAPRTRTARAIWACRWSADAARLPLCIPTPSPARRRACSRLDNIEPVRFDSLTYACDASGIIALIAGSRHRHSRRPSSFRHRSTPEVPFLDRHYPASSVVRTSPPPRPAQPAPHGVPVGACHTTDRASRVAPIPLFHACRRQYPGGTSRCACRSLPGQWQPSPTYRRVGSRIPGFEACSAFTRVAARMVAGSPKATRYTEVLRTMSLPPSSAPIATGWSDSLPGGIRTR